MLQQTRAQAVIPYYHRFLERFPAAESLAAAPEADVLAMWSGLGYYSRARNLRRAASLIAAAGQFPHEYEQIRELPGVGPYTAAAVASIAFGAPHAVVDGNVLRVISRVCADAGNIQSSKTRARFQQIADEWLDRNNPGLFNQAMMELGATICLPKAPQCLLCPVQTFCEAQQSGRQREFPVRAGRRKPERIGLAVAIVVKNGNVLLRRRGAAESLMPGFWELPAPGDLPGWHPGESVGSFRHTITHHYYTIRVMRGHLRERPRGFRWHRIETLRAIPLTTVSRKAMDLFRVQQPKAIGQGSS